jgi:hypothetical protein
MEGVGMKQAVASCSNLTQKRLDFCKEQIELTRNLLSKIQDSEPYSKIRAEVLRNRLGMYEEELDKLMPEEAKL